MRVFNYKEEDLDLFYKSILNRSPEGQEDVESYVSDILKNVKARGDEALIEYTKRFDKTEITTSAIEVTDQMDNALVSIDKNMLRIIERAASNIGEFHEKQKEKSWFFTKEPGIILGQKISPLERVGVYAPAGTAPLPSSVLMDVIPAKVAGVEEIILCSPPSTDGKVNQIILACAKLAGVDRAFMIGGAQAIGAMAYGTETVPKVDKIVGPGNIFVATAKKQVFGICGIDMIAGPSEILIIADETANSAFVAADLLSQAEHDSLSSSILITCSESLAKEVEIEIDKQITQLERSDIAQKSLDNYGAIIVTETIEQAISISNEIAPEHLELCVKDAFTVMPSIKNAAAIFLGNYSPEPLGDYFAGPNHTLPTSGTAKFFSPLGVYDFVKKQSIISYSQEAFKEVCDDVAAFAYAEGLTAHAKAIEIRK